MSTSASTPSWHARSCSTGPPPATSSARSSTRWGRSAVSTTPVWPGSACARDGGTSTTANTPRWPPSSARRRNSPDGPARSTSSWRRWPSERRAWPSVQNTRHPGRCRTSWWPRRVTPGTSGCGAKGSASWRSSPPTSERRPTAVALLDQARAAHHAIDDLEGEALVVGQLGATYIQMGGHLDEARRASEEAMAMFVATGHRLRLGIVQGNLAAIAIEQGRLDDALELGVRNLELATEVEDMEGIVSALPAAGGRPETPRRQRRGAATPRGRDRHRTPAGAPLLRDLLTGSSGAGGPRRRRSSMPPWHTLPRPKRRRPSPRLPIPRSSPSRAPGSPSTGRGISRRRQPSCAGLRRAIARSAAWTRPTGWRRSSPRCCSTPVSSTRRSASPEASSRWWSGTCTARSRAPRSSSPCTA